MHDGFEIPTLGLGTWDIRGNAVATSITSALTNNYRLIDTATYYRNESEVGSILQNLFSSGEYNRTEVFVTTKVWPTDFGTKKTAKLIQQSLIKLKLDYVDLLLLHWPGNNQLARHEAWRVMYEQQGQGKVKSIGVSNFDIDQLEAILAQTDAKPVLNQISLSPFNYDPSLIKYCDDNQILVEAYSPLGQGRHLDNSELKNLADKYGKSVAQILIRWGIQHSFVVIPKSSHPTRIKENISIFDFSLTRDDMSFLDNMSN